MTMSPDSTPRNRKKIGHGSGHQILTGVTVRHEKALDFSGCDSRPTPTEPSNGCSCWLMNVGAADKPQRGTTP